MTFAHQQLWMCETLVPNENGTAPSVSKYANIMLLLWGKGYGSDKTMSNYIMSRSISLVINYFHIVQ